jgi:hypothetical protein
LAPRKRLVVLKLTGRVTASSDIADGPKSSLTQ